MDSCLQRLRESIAAATHGMTVADLTRHPVSKWSTGEVLEHLYLTYTGTIKGLEKCLQAGRPLGGSPTLKQRLIAATVVGVGYMPRGRQAPSRTLPRGMPAERVVPELLAEIAVMDELIAQCEARYGKPVKLMDHPVLGPLTAQQWRKFHWVHGRHHLKQIQKLRAAR
jgi:Protein of unknown function (DUF1569)